ncbi:MAG TPA: outer membrane protein assembly factor BamD [Gemmatimonadaceae bacterium]|nr:outer membrane protein assembly factor BamD [Gemmatimonadaceae bacterium]
MNRFIRYVSQLSSARYLVFVVALSACHPEFDPKLYPQPEQLFAVGLKEYNLKHWENAVQAFDQLTRFLPARDPLLPLSYFYLGKAQDQGGDHLLAAQSFAHVAESFPEDSLAPRALLNGGQAYASMWQKPQLTPEYGQFALSTLQSLLALYPDSPLVPAAQKEIARIDGLLAEKDYETGHHYLKRHAYDSAIIYFKDVLRLHPDTPAARKASLQLYDAYTAIKYTDDARDLCQTMLKTYPHDQEVIVRCGSGSSAAASTLHT